MKLKEEEIRRKELVTLLKKEKKALGSYKKTVDFKEPVLFLIGEDYKVRFFEGVKGDKLEITLKNGEKGLIMLDSSKLLSFPYGNKTFRGWIAYAREAVPYPTNIQHDSNILRKLIQSILANYKSYKAKEIEGWRSIIWTIGILILLYFVGKWLFMPSTTHTVAKTAVQNITNVTKNLTLIKP